MVMSYVMLAGLLLLLVLALVEGAGHLRRRLLAGPPPRHGEDPDWVCSSGWRLPERRR
jgi:hypothetical protein